MNRSVSHRNDKNRYAIIPTLLILRRGGFDDRSFRGGPVMAQRGSGRFAGCRHGETPGFAVRARHSWGAGISRRKKIKIKR